MTVFAIGTLKGGFLLDTERAKVEGPFFKGWKVTAATRDARGTAFVATASDVYGAAIHTSQDLREWRQVERGPAYSKESGRKLNQIWKLATGPSGLWAGVDEAGLFTSADGERWDAVAGLNDHPTRSRWMPGFGGLCAHALLFDAARSRVWCGISAVGVFRSDDGGATFAPRNEGVPAALEDQEEKAIGRCVHALVQDPRDPDVIWRQDHLGMFRTKDGGESWQRIEEGLPSRFGFPLALHGPTRTLFSVPLESDEFRMPPGGRLRVYRSKDGGDSWEPLERGLPREGFHAGVLRGALACDEAGHVVLGSTAGTLHLSHDVGESWRPLDATLPRILSVTAL